MSQTQINHPHRKGCKGKLRYWYHSSFGTIELNCSQKNCYANATIDIDDLLKFLEDLEKVKESSHE